MSDIASGLPPPPDHPQAEDFQAWMAEQMATDFVGQAQVRRIIEDVVRRLPHWALTRKWGGSGLLMSSVMRQYFIEYLNRTINVSIGIHSLPTSFNVVEAFFFFDRDFHAFDLRPEIEHLLSADEYFTWYEKGSMPAEPTVLIDVMKEATTYSFNMSSNPLAYSLKRGTSQLALAGVSLVRHRDELSCILIAGEKPPNLLCRKP